MDQNEFIELIEKVEAFLEKKDLDLGEKYDFTQVMYERAKSEKLDFLEGVEQNEEIEEDFDDELEDEDFESEDDETSNVEEEPQKEENAKLDDLDQEIVDELKEEVKPPRKETALNKLMERKKTLVKRPKMKIQ